MVLRMMMSAGHAFSPPKLHYGVRLDGPPPQRITPARGRVLEVAANGLTWMKSALAEAAGVSPGVIDGLVDAGTLVTEELPAWAPPRLDLSTARARLTPEQAAAAEELRDNTRDGFAVTLLDGVTGSGKTEVYFEAIAEALAKGKQALVLMPEIALTSQFIARCEQRFGAKPAEWHSGLSAPLRGRVWRAIAEDQAKLVVGARSALFLPFPALGLIVVDEEHDQSYKQEERVTYQARDMAVLRGSLGRFPRGVELGDALDREPGERGPRPLRPRQARAALQGREPPRHHRHRHAARSARARQMAVAAPRRSRRRDLGARRAGAAVPEPARLRAGHRLPQLRLQIRMPELLRLARRAPLSPQARMPPLRHLHSHPRDLPELRRRAFAGAVRTGHRAHRRGDRRIFPRRAARAVVERPDAERQRSPRDLARDRGPRGRYHHRHPARGQGPPLPGARARRRRRRRSRPRPCRPARRGAHLPAAQSGDGARRPRRHDSRPRPDPDLYAGPPGDRGAGLRRPRHLPRARDRGAEGGDHAAVRPAGGAAGDGKRARGG